jgi:NADH:ubiquinone oxidoreductase subunit E
MTNAERADKWMADNLVRDTGRRRDALVALLDEVQDEALSASLDCVKATADRIRQLSHRKL